MTDIAQVSLENAEVALSQAPLFLPHRFVRSGHIQTLLSRHRPPGAIHQLTNEQPILLDAGPSVTPLDAGEHVRMLAYYTPCWPTVERRGLVSMLHGWEGCSHSPYDIMMTNTLMAAGFDVVRLNFRDHGPGYHVNPYTLNRGLFLGTLLDEAVHVTHAIAALASGLPFYIVGVSMGGNFALRLACHHRQQPFANLARVIAINPAANPARATDLIDRQPIYRRHFRKRWLASLLAKQRFFPELYDFTGVAQLPTIRGMTDWLVQRYGHFYGDFRTATEYFAQYAVPAAELAQLTVPVTLIAAMDDPVIDAADLMAFAPHPLLDRQLHPTGGHVGFVSIFPFQHHLPTMVLQALLR